MWVRRSQRGRRRRGKAGRRGARRSGDPNRFRVARGPAAAGMRSAVLSRLLPGAKLTQVVEVPQHLIQECLRARRLCGVRFSFRRRSHGHLHGSSNPAHKEALPLPALLRVLRGRPCAASVLLRWRRPGSRAVAVLSATALGGLEPPRSKEPPPAAAPQPRSRQAQAPPGTAATPWMFLALPAPASRSARPAPALCSSTR